MSRVHLADESRQILVQARQLSKTFSADLGLFRQRFSAIRAVHDVSLNIERGRTLAVMGESGCGKTTLAKIIVGLLRPTSGTVLFESHDVFARLSRTQRMEIRRQVQMVFQNPQASLDPMMSVRAALSEPFAVHGVPCTNKRLVELLKLVGLTEDHLDRLPRELSGGQQQRVGICRAIALNPSLVVLDEPTSALDVSVQAQVLNLLIDLKSIMAMTYLLITHNAAVAEYVSDEVAIMYFGRVVETAPTYRVFSAPRHPYTEMLAECVLTPHSCLRAAPAGSSQGDPVETRRPERGCPFFPRCTYAESLCSEISPDLNQVEAGHMVACRMAGADPSAVPDDLGWEEA